MICRWLRPSEGGMALSGHSSSSVRLQLQPIRKMQGKLHRSPGEPRLQGSAPPLSWRGRPASHTEGKRSPQLPAQRRVPRLGPSRGVAAPGLTAARGGERCSGRGIRPDPRSPRPRGPRGPRGCVGPAAPATAGGRAQESPAGREGNPSASSRNGRPGTVTERRIFS